MDKAMVEKKAKESILRDSKFHFVGVGGIGMCGLAELLHNMGAKVTGSDQVENLNTEHLKNLGITIFHGHDSFQVGEADVVVYSSAVPSDNPEIMMAMSKKIPLIPRAEALSEIMRLKRGIAIAGTHGKTTTTSMIAAIFLEAGAEPTIVVGGRLDLIQSTALLGQGNWLIAEADESDGSFHRLSPEIAIITNIDSDHLDYFKTFENLQKEFLNFAGRIPFYGAVIAWGDDPVIKTLFERYPKAVITYGFSSSNDYVLKGSHGHYELFGHGHRLGDFEIKVPGTHNALNASAGIITGLKAGFSFETCRRGLLKFQGVDRRFHYKGKLKEPKDVLVYDDYGHHPTEVVATLQGCREKFPEKRLVVLFQPHRFTRTQSCWSEFKTCFSQCDELILMDVYSAGEVAIEGISSERLAAEMKRENRHNQVSYLAQTYFQTHELPEKIRDLLRAGDLFLTLGAGDVWKVGARLCGKT